MNKYNVSNKTICVKDAIRAINEGEFKITFEKVPPKEQKPVVINYRPKFEVGGNQVNQFKFTHTRFWSPRKMPDNLKKQYNTQKEKIQFVGTRKLQVMSSTGNAWKRQGNSDLFDFIDHYARVYGQALTTSTEGKPIAKYANEDKFGIKRADDDNSAATYYKLRTLIIPKYTDKEGKEQQGGIATRFYDVEVKENDGKFYLTRGDLILKEKSQPDDLYDSKIAKRGLYFAWGIFRGGQIAVHTTTGLMGHGFELQDCYILNDDEEDKTEIDDIKRSLALDSVNESLKEVIENSKKLKQSSETVSSEGSGDITGDGVGNNENVVVEDNDNHQHE